MIKYYIIYIYQNYKNVLMKNLILPINNILIIRFKK